MVSFFVNDEQMQEDPIDKGKGYFFAAALCEHKDHAFSVVATPRSVIDIISNHHWTLVVNSIWRVSFQTVELGLLIRIGLPWFWSSDNSKTDQNILLRKQIIEILFVLLL